MGLFSKLFGESSSKKANPTKQDLMEQRQALTQKIMTADRQERLAQAFQVQAVKQQLKQRMQSDAGQRELAAKIQRLMKEG